MDEALSRIAGEVQEAIELRQLHLPTLPDVAIKVRKALDDPNLSADHVINLISSDPAITAQLVKAANSALATGKSPVNTPREAVSRLGYRMTHNLVVTMAMNNLFKAENKLINQQLLDLWQHSRRVAAYSFVIASQHKPMKPEQAMLAGLLHNLGALPLFIYADRHHPQLGQEALQALVRRFGTRTGTILLQHWGFPEEIVSVVANYEKLHRAPDSDTPDYIDVVTVANLLAGASAKFVAWQNVPASRRFGCTEAECRAFQEEHADELAAACEMMGLPGSSRTARQNAISQERKPRTSSPAPRTSSSGLLDKIAGLFK